MNATVTSISGRRNIAVARPPVYTPAETAKRLGVGHRTLHRMEAAGKLRVAFRTPGKHRRYLKADVDALTGGAS